MAGRVSSIGMVRVEAEKLGPATSQFCGDGSPCSAGASSGPFEVGSDRTALNRPTGRITVAKDPHDSIAACLPIMLHNGFL